MDFITVLVIMLFPCMITPRDTVLVFVLHRSMLKADRVLVFELNLTVVSQLAVSNGTWSSIGS